MYYNGDGVTQDYVQAHLWFNLAENQATDSNVRAGEAEARDLAAARMTLAQVTEAKRLAREWKPQ
jgi:TPR repeat protein